MSAEKKLKELGITLPAVSSPSANYVNAVQTGNLLFLAGKGPLAVTASDPRASSAGTSPSSRATSTRAPPAST